MWIVELIIWLGGIIGIGWWLSSLLFVFTNPLFCLVVVYFWSYARGHTKNSSGYFVGIIAMIVYIVGIFIVSVCFVEELEPIVKGMGLVFSFVPVANWVNALIWSLLVLNKT